MAVRIMMWEAIGDTSFFNKTTHVSILLFQLKTFFMMLGLMFCRDHLVHQI